MLQTFQRLISPAISTAIRNTRQVCAIAKEENAEVLPICAQIEAEISGMSDEDKELFLADMHLESSGLAQNHQEPAIICWV